MTSAVRNEHSQPHEFLWRHFPTDKEHILLTPAVAFGCRGGEQEEVHSMTQWKRRFTDRSSMDTNNTRCTTQDGGARATEMRLRKGARKGATEEERMWKENMWKSRSR